MSEALLAVHGLVTEFDTDTGRVRAVDDVSFDVQPGETLGLVGESGCGKSVTALSILRLLPQPMGRIARGEIRFAGENLAQLPLERMRAIRGARIGMVFQEPMTALNPVHTIGRQLAEALLLHENSRPREALQRSMALLDRVGIPAPDIRLGEYPHQLSGGMRQRVVIAMALACKPDLLIADEPTTALDVTVQAQILDLIEELQRDLGMAVILITHDLGVIAETSDRAVVMYAGRIAEKGTVYDIFDRPAHPYTPRAAGVHPDLGDNAESNAAGHRRHGARPARPAARLSLREPLRPSPRKMRRAGAQRGTHRRRTQRQLSALARDRYFLFLFFHPSAGERPDEGLRQSA